MQCAEDYVPAKFIERPNRFLAIVELKNISFNDEMLKRIKAHVPDPGRLKELLVHGTDVILRRSSNNKRKTQFSLVGVKNNNIWVNIDSQISNKLFHEEFSKIEPLFGYRIKRGEFTYGKSRIDFLLEHKETKNEALVEIKSVTLVEGKQALFPDAPTKRGLKHVLELIDSLKEYSAAFIVFIIKRNDPEMFKPNYTIDPDFAKTLLLARDKGVFIIAVKCIYDPVKTKTLRITEEIKVILD
ncbi:MAG: DNA/RNA nuclease SfsA [Candidatus Hodarchaeales archaeon]